MVVDMSLVRENAQRFWALYSGKRRVLGEALITHDPFDQFAWCQEWRFVLAQYLTDRGEHVPDFRTGPGAQQELRDGLEYYTLLLASPDTDELWYALRILDRYREWLRIAGKDY